MNKDLDSFVWNGMAASVPGNGHLRRELPCQDASAYFDFGHPTLIALDGRGSSPLSQEGSAEGVRFFRSMISVIEPWLRLALDVREPLGSTVRHLGEIVHRTLVQAKRNCAWNHGGNIDVDAFDFTAAVTIVGKCNIACFQVGDGAIVVSEHGVTRTVFVPDKGEEANTTSFVRDRDDGFRMEVLPVDGVDGIAVMTDGIEHRVLDLRTLSPGPLFATVFDELRAGSFRREDLLEFLTDNSWWGKGDDMRDADDRTLGVMTPTIVRGRDQETIIQSKSTSKLSE